jgi:hypothetical protein
MYTHEINGERNKGKEREKIVTNKLGQLKKFHLIGTGTRDLNQLRYRVPPSFSANAS